MKNRPHHSRRETRERFSRAYTQRDYNITPSHHKGDASKKMEDNMKKLVMDLGDREQLEHLATLIIERKFQDRPDMTVAKLIHVLETKVFEVMGSRT